MARLFWTGFFCHLRNFKLGEYQLHSQTSTTGNDFWILCWSSRALPSNALFAPECHRDVHDRPVMETGCRKELADETDALPNMNTQRHQDQHCNGGNQVQCHQTGGSCTQPAPPTMR